MNVKKKVLININNTIAALDLKYICGEFNYVCIFSHSSVSDLKRIVDSVQPELIFIDLIVKTGQDLLSAAEEIYNTFNVPVIFFTIEPRISIETDKINDRWLIQPVPFTSEEINTGIKTLTRKYEQRNIFPV